jgi:FKBP-type peptidyl-prolyl cis-trans isomerase FkpA
MKVGGTTKFVIPSELAYGDAGAPPKILGGATLIFEVQLLGIEAAPAAAPVAAPAKKK